MTHPDPSGASSRAPQPAVAGDDRLDPASPLPIATLIHQSPLALGEIVRRMGYANPSKGVRRLEELKQGDSRHAATLVPALATALGLEAAEAWKAFEDTRYIHRARRDREYRARFRPHAIYLGSRTRPSPAFGVNLKPLVFEPDMPPWEMVARAVAAAPEGVPLLGRTTGFWLNYAPDRSVRYDLQGLPQEVRQQAEHRRGEFGLD
jgi:hypothetical protein